MTLLKREANGPYATWLAGLLVGFGLAWIAYGGAAIYGLTHGGPLDDVPPEPGMLVLIGVVSLLLALFPMGAAVRIRWKPRTSSVSSRVPKAALVSVVLGGTLAVFTVYFEFNYSWQRTDWHVVVCGVVVVAAAVSAVVLMFLRRRHGRSVRD